jgi:hypothetical protein
MVIPEVVSTLFFYIISIAPAYFGVFLFYLFSQFRRADEVFVLFCFQDLSFVVSLAFAWKVGVIMLFHYMSQTYPHESSTCSFEQNNM